MASSRTLIRCVVTSVLLLILQSERTQAHAHERRALSRHHSAIAGHADTHSEPAHGSLQPLSANELRGSLRITPSPNGRGMIAIAEPSASPNLLSEPSTATVSTSATAASAALAAVRSSIGLPDGCVAEAVRTVRVGAVWQSTFALSVHGIPVREASVQTTIGAISGKIMTIVSTMPSQPAKTNAATLSATQLFSDPTRYLGEDRSNAVTSITTPQLVYLPITGGELRLCYEATVRQSTPPHAWCLDVDATTGRLLRKHEELCYLDDPQHGQTGKLHSKILCAVHMHSPFDTLTYVGLPNTLIRVDGQWDTTDAAGYWSVDDTNATPSVLTGFFGPNYSVIRYDAKTDTAILPTLKSPYWLVWNDKYSNAAERDAYYHVNVARQYMLRLDSTLAVGLDAPMKINVNLNAACNAFYDADSASLNFFRAGNECNNSGEIADIIYHEFGHRVACLRYCKTPNGSQCNITVAEGFADALSAFMCDDPRIGQGFFQADPKRVLRNCDNQLAFPGDVTSDPHVTGQIVSGAFWDLERTLGQDTGEMLFHKAEWLAPDGPDQTSPDVLGPLFTSILLDVLLVDDNDNDLSNGTPHSGAILASFAKHGISLSYLIHLTPIPTPDQDTNSAGYAIKVAASYASPYGAIDPEKLVVHYSTDNWNTYATGHFTQLHDSVYQVVINSPQDTAPVPYPPGTIISYFVTAGLTLPNSGLQQLAAPNAPLTFLLGYQREYFDDCEHDRGWSLSASSDNAVRGRWVRAVPYGTYNIPGHFVQQDTDHTPGSGTMCYVTGNRISREIWDDCVDSGTTSLTSPVIAISGGNPVLRYWYYYSNDQYLNPGLPEWVCQLSSDRGATWKTFDDTHVSTNGWTSKVIRMADQLPGATELQLRFVASNTVQAVVEAGVDDVEILASEGTASVALPSALPVAASSLTAVYPDPVDGHQRDHATVRYGLVERDRVIITLKNLYGDVVAHVTDEELPAGTYETPVPTQRLALGVYWIDMSTAHGARSIRRLVVE